MKKERILILLILTTLFTISLTFAADDDIEKAYSCLKSQLKDNCGGTQNTEQASFNLLAMSYDSKFQSDCKSQLESKKKENCWGETGTSSCTLKATALATLALKNIGQNTDDSIKWILSKKNLKTGLTWFLEIDANNLTECDINTKKIILNENKKISGQDPAGLIKSYNNYWFEITNLNKNFTISCNKDFITALLYKKPGSNVIHVSSATHFTSAGDSITESVNAYCFSTSSECDYEGSLWASLALAKNGDDVSQYIPYLSAMSEEAINKKYLPYSFLYLLTNADDYSSGLLSQQVQGKYWDVSNRRLYDTALALLAVRDLNTNEVDSAKEYLLSVQEKTGDSAGCWHDNTAFILYSGWPKEVSKTTGGLTSTDCETFGHYCVSSMQCKLEDKLNNFYCTSLSDICCTNQPAKEETCADKNGILCREDEECSGQEIQSSDTSICCQGTCEKIEKTNECEELSYSCKSKCADDEEEKIATSSSCNFGEICCGKKAAKKTNWLLIILLVVLIILLVLAILFRNQLRIWIFRTKTGFGYGKPSFPMSRPPISPTGFRPILTPRPQPARLYQRVPARQAGRGRPEKDKEFEDVMKKLKEMSK